MLVAPSTTADAKIVADYKYGYIWLISLVAALGGLLFGYDWIVISGADLFYEKFFGLTSSFEVGWAKSCALVGCLLGAMLSGVLSDKFGRKRLLILSALLFAFSSLGTGWADHYHIFVLWRIIGGVAIGLASSLSPVYIAEIAPAPIRGKLVSLNQLTIVSGVLMAQFVNWCIARPISANATAREILQSWNGQMGWRWMFVAAAVPAVLFFLGMFVVPESPRWLAKNGKESQAREVLAKVGGGDYAKAAIAEIRSTLVDEIAHVNFQDLLEPRMKKILVFGVLIAVLQQWCGINTIFYYSKDVFAAAGYKVSDILLNIVIIGLANLIFTFVAIATVDKLGRRFLFLMGLAGLAIIYVLIAAGYFFKMPGLPMVALVVAAIACYACTLGPVTWVILSEIFPNRIRGAAMSIAVITLWTACFLLALTFPILNASLGAAGTYLIYAAICAAGFVYIFARLPETKGKTLEQLERELVD